MKSLKSIFPWVSIYLLLVLLPLLFLMFGTMPSGSGFWWDFSMALGFTSLAMMGVQFLLTARFKRASAPFGIDIIYYFHRYLAVIAVLMVFAHFLFLLIYHPTSLGVLNPLLAPWHMTAGRVALVLFSVLIITSLWRKPLHIRYEYWRWLHIVLAITAFLLSLGHILGAGYYIEAPSKRLLWSAYTLFWLLLIAYVRLFKPWRIKQKPYRVTQVRQEQGDSWTLALQPDGHIGIRFKPGQFVWLTLQDSPWKMKEHPFSISSSSENTKQLELTIKELGDFTRTIKNTQVGDIAYLDGPYGEFTTDRYPVATGFVFIAGGVGVAPMLSMLSTLADRHDKRPMWFFYGNKTWEDVIFREELDTLSKRLDLTLVHCLIEPSHDWQGKSGVINTELLQSYLPKNATNLEYFLCGPKPMSDAVQKSLNTLNVRSSRVHFELFDMV